MIHSKGKSTTQPGYTKSDLYLFSQDTCADGMD